MITRNQRNKSNIKLIGTWILQTIRPCQKDYHCETRWVFTVPSFHLKIQPFNSIWGFHNEQCAQSFTLSARPSLFRFIASFMRHGQLNVVWCDKTSVRHAKWLFNSDRIPITNNGLPFNSWLQFKILWSICSSPVYSILYAVHCTSTKTNSFSEHNLCTLFYECKKVIEFHGEQSIKWNGFWSIRVAWRKGVELQIQKTSRIMCQRIQAEACPNSTVYTINICWCREHIL